VKPVKTAELREDRIVLLVERYPQGACMN